MPEAVLLAQGNELTTGSITDTNSGWIAQRLWELGITVRRIVAAPDRLDDLVAILKDAATLADVVISTGGLGPTRDDLTAEAAALAFDQPLAHHDEAMAQVEARFAQWNRPMAPSNRKQARLPSGCTVLENRRGTAPGFAVDAGSCRLYFLPGVPKEMKAMVDAVVLPDIAERHALVKPVLHTVRVVGVGESELEMRLRGVEVDGLEIGFRSTGIENHVKLQFRPDVPEVVRAAAVQDVLAAIGPQAYGVDSGDLAEVVGQHLADRAQTVALAESCTAGRVAAWLADVPGSSRYLIEGAVVYANAAKVRTAGVDPADLQAHGAVSEPVARQLARGIRERAGTTWGVGITGIAGPGGGTKTKPVGLVYVTIAGPDVVTCREYRFPGDRDRVRRFSTVAALRQLLRAIRLHDAAELG